MSTDKDNKGRVRLGTGGGHGLTGETAQTPMTTIKRVFGYARPYQGRLILVSVLVIINTLASLAGPILIGKAIDDSVAVGDLAGLLQTGLAMLVVYLVGGAAAIVYGILMVTIAQKMVAVMRADLFGHLQTLSMAFHQQHQAGDLMSRVTNDTEAINRVFTNGLIEFVTNILQLAGIMVAMFLLNWQLAIGTLIIMPMMVLITMFITRLSRAAFREVQFNLGALNAAAEESISGIRVVQAFSRAEDTIAHYEKVNAANRKSGVRANIITASLGPMFTTMSTITIAATVFLGGWLSLQGLVTVGVLATFVIYIMNFFRPMRSIAMLYNFLQSALAGAERIFEVLDTGPLVRNVNDAVELIHVHGQVTFEDVTFGYEAEKPVLADISLQAEPGQTVALVGPTGAGKTTVIALLSRFYDVDQGRILIDDVDIRQMTQESLRRQLGIVLQDTFLFSGSVMENIRYGRLEATDDEVYAAAKVANADWFIRRLPDGYQSQISEQGHNFSEGQKQLLAIARAVLADPGILILDEATSSVDTRTELMIQEALLRLMEGRTAFVIAHRLRTIRTADQVLVIDDGRIIERGNHDSLLADEGHYYNLYMSQFRHSFVESDEREMADQSN